jgi:hypothetical protein
MRHPLAIPLLLFTCVSASPGVAADGVVNPGYRLPADVPAMSVGGPTGGMTIPSGRLLPDGALALGINNSMDPRYAQAARADNYLFGLGVLPGLELSGRIVNYPIDLPKPRNFLIRDLSANIKLALPKMLRDQPEIAVGINDLHGGASRFGSKYLAASERFGPALATVGVARGAPSLNGWFGGLEVILGNDGLSALAERHGGVIYGGLRFASKPVAALGNASVVATAQRSAGAYDTLRRPFDRTVAVFQLVIPLGRADAVAHASRRADAPSRAIAADIATANPEAALAAPAASTPIRIAAPAAVAMVGAVERHAPVVSGGWVHALHGALERAGLERVRVGLASNKLVVAYENHRYNRNEADALGIVLGAAAMLAPDQVTRVAAITKRAGLAMYETSIDRDGFRRYLSGGAGSDARRWMEVAMHPRDDGTVRWLDESEGARGYSRVVVTPVLRSFVGTEYGVLDYSLAVAARPIVPLWPGAELSAEVAAHVADSDDVRRGVYAYAHQRSGLKSALLSQTFWLGDHVLNVTTAGRLQYDYRGVQNETLLLVPGGDDLVRVEYSRVHFSDAFQTVRLVSAGAFYSWRFEPLHLSVEAGLQQYTGNDRGPSLSVTRWFGDVQAQATLRRSGQHTFAGFQLAFPLTPRQGMRPGYTHVEGASRFAYGLTTQLAHEGQRNAIMPGVGESISPTYDMQDMLLNQGRFSRAYLITQLPRMRDAAWQYLATLLPQTDWRNQ